MSYEEIGRLTLAQLRNAQHEGKPPIPGTQTFSSTKEARAARGQ